MDSVEVQEIKFRLKAVEEKFTTIDLKLTSGDKKLDKLLLFMYNDDESGRKGIIQSVQEVRVDLDGLLERERTASAIKKREAVIYGSIGGGILMFLKYIGGVLMHLIK